MRSRVIHTDNFYDWKNICIVTGITAIYLFLSAYLLGYKSDQVTLAVIFNVCYYASSLSRKFILGFSIFIVYWIIFDTMKAFPNYNYSAVHLEDFYNFEKSIFGFHYQGRFVTPNEFFLQYRTNFLTTLTGIFYLCWVPVPLAFAAYLFYKKREQFLRFALCFFLVNLLGFVLYYTFPVAPPWYLPIHGFDFHPLTPGNAGGLRDFDKLYDVTVFKKMYEKSSNVFGAMPSLHSAFPVLLTYYAYRFKIHPVIVGIFATIMLGIWFAAVYNSHHYITDVISGIICAILAIFIMNKSLRYSPFVKKWFNKYLAVIS